MELVMSKHRTISLYCLMFHFVAIAFGTNTTRVLTQQGYVRGIRQDIQTHQGQTKTIYKFLGVPYVEKPIGNLRFKPPQALSNQRLSDYNATDFRPICIQSGNYFDSISRAWPEFDPKRDMSEDCLYLNIYTPSTNSTWRYPVIVHIHGGSYYVGTPTRDILAGEYLPTRGVVLVTIQYRLGPFGFFTTGDSEAPGNLGLLDQVEALKWVQRNINSFGGDNNSVTLLGESAGGSSVALHYLSPLSSGLFHRGIAVSGVDFCPFAYKPKSSVLAYSKELVKNVNCTRNSSQLIVQCLQLVSSTNVFTNSRYWLLQPFVDQHFLPDNPKALKKRGQFLKLPLMAGFVSQEGSFVLEFEKVNVYDDRSFRTYLESFFELKFGRKVHNAQAAYSALKSQYTPDNNDPSEYRKKLVEMLSDFYVTAPTHPSLTFQSENSTANFMFEFAHRSQFHPKPQWMGVVHEDTTAYKFGLPLLSSNPSELRFDDNDRNVSDMVVTMFTNFAKFGNPTPTAVNGVQWASFNSSLKNYLKIQSNPVMTSNYYPQRMTFWNSRFPMLFPNNSTLPSSTGPQSRGTKVIRDELLILPIW
ncbi:cholinesterase 1-like [Actinia tenebrosa]|uniref:Carboxylic ester hydrolase n=1 Tax=Actinia tenebrosa TaxID=6105 RepID=A0A6P8I6C4_ACTTE|nr:cholinesterase 1-like [Actinia tenebrosa]